MTEIEETIQKYKTAEKDKTFPFSEWHRKDVFERLIKPFIITMHIIQLFKLSSQGGDKK